MAIGYFPSAIGGHGETPVLMAAESFRAATTWWFFAEVKIGEGTIIVMR